MRQLYILVVIGFIQYTITATTLPHQCVFQTIQTSPDALAHQFSQVSLSPYEIRVSDEVGEGSMTQIHPTALAAAAACYQYCNQSELMTFSSQFWKHRQDPLTLLDRATRILLETDFFKVNETYFVNHMTMADQDGAGGLGCFALETPSTFSLHALDDPLCRFTRTVICGGGANADDHVKPVLQESKSGGGRINLAETITRATSQMDASHFKSEFSSGIKQEDEDTEEDEITPRRESLALLNFYLSSSLSSPCDQMGSLDSTSLPLFTSWIQQQGYSLQTTIRIRAWNGDTYTGGCLVFSLAQGIHVSSCNKINMVLCEKKDK